MRTVSTSSRSETPQLLDSLQPETVDFIEYGSPDPDPEKYRLNEIEARINVLETAILEHATILRDRIGQRLDRLEEKLRFESNGLREAMQNQGADRDDKIIRLSESLTAAVDRVELNQQAGSVQATMEDLIAALVALRQR